MFPADVPLDPTPDQAREWLTEELRKPEYAQQHWLQDFFTWLRHLGEDVPSDTRSMAGWTFVTLALVAALAILCWFIIRARTTATQEARQTSALVDPTISAEQYLAAARQAFDAEDWDGAVMNGFRATVANLDRRGILGDRPGRTAQEAGAVVAAAFPLAGAAVVAAAGWFDQAAYGMRPAPRTTKVQAVAVLAIADTLSAAKPSPTQGATV
ncbi:MAG: DUF4129 domain-containing protein [Propionibacteriaceae bacterium]|jgi:hypothetical protein|nr:DUF4129 domain-containing protein [Micropruina sp.]HBX81481.1 hypothetical protein [Propionibacteriaceae bacterium]